MKFHNHPKMEDKLNVDKDHVIIDRDLFEALLEEWAIERESRESNLDEDGFCKICKWRGCPGGWTCPGAY